MDTHPGRDLERKAVISLGLGDWIDSGHSVLGTGPTGAGKSWLACALVHYACQRGHSALYQRVPLLGEELRIRHGNGTFHKWLLKLAKTDVLLLDDWGKTGLGSRTRADLLEIIDDQAANKATIIISQLLIEHWHAWVGDATIANAILDCVMQRKSFHPEGRVSMAKAKSPAKSRSIRTHRDRCLYNLIAQHFTLRDRSRSTGISGHDRRNTQRKNCERKLDTSLQFIHLAFLALLLRRSSTRSKSIFLPLH